MNDAGDLDVGDFTVGNAEAQQNRRTRRAAGQRGAHRVSTPPRRTALGLIGFGTALAVMAGGAGTAAADPMFNPVPPSAGNPTLGTSNPTPPPTADVGPGAIVDPPIESGWRPNPYSNNKPTYVPIQNWAPAPQPTFIGPVVLPPPPPLIMPEPGKVRVGKYQEVKPPWMTMAEMNSINRWAAYTESRVAQFWLSQGFSAEEADRRAASMTVGGIIGGAAGGAAGFAVGVVPGAIGGAAVGALAGLGAGAGTAAALGLPLNALFPVAGTGLYGSFIGIGALAGAAAGTAVGALVGGTAGGLLVGVPSAAIGVGLGSLFGGGDPNVAIDQPWNYRDGEGVITPKANDLEFDWDATKSNMLPGGWVLPEEAHVNLQVKDDNTYVLKLGEERWLGATEEQRDQFFYAEMDKALPGAGGVAKDFLENENGAFQNGLRDVLGNIAGGDPATAQFNPEGDIADTSVRAERVPYPTTSTPDPWDEPNRDGVTQQNELNRIGEALPGLGVAPLTVAAPTPAAVAPVQAEQPVSSPGPVAPQPIQDALTTAPEPVRQAVDDAQRALGDLIPGLLGA